MNILTIWEKDGGTTRIRIPVDAIAIDMARYFREEIELLTMLESTDEHLSLEGEEEERATLYLNEWRNFNTNKLSIVK